ncbi:alpha beta hydrolase fold family [Cordyceps militaris]|uniref:Alpha beta hydrolase fold family n=1 Tax=Cordyceps militaris TaxID=73501 RepID=A0A2H4S7E6_CORMI|nr:alpha beta hydrolase fold family [Cordyceps militaris]
MIGNSPPKWALIQLSVVIFRFAPLLLALFFLALGAHSAPHHTAQAVLGSLLVAEALFYVLLYRPHLRRATARAAHPTPPLTRAARLALFQQCLAHARDPAAYLRGWFLGAPLGDVGHDAVREFLCWAFFDAEAEDPAMREEMDGYVAALEERLGHRFAEGRGTAKSLRLTLEPVETAYRGLAWYAVMALVDAATCALLRGYGFRLYGRSSTAEVLATFPPRPQELLSSFKSPAPKLGYWYYGPPSRTARAGDREPLPVVFLHGIGVGLLTYLRFLFDLVKAADVQSRQEGNGAGIRIIAVEMLPVSFRLTSLSLDKRAFLEAFTAIVDAHGWDDFAIVSHSYGSVPTTHILTGDEALSRRVRAVTLVDPVTVLLHLPHVAYNFTRRRPRTAAEWQLWYFASADVGTATVLGRHFFWRQNIVWKEDLLRRPGGGGHRRVTVSLAAKDIIVNAPAVAEYLREPENAAVGDNAESCVGVLWFPQLDHAQVFDTPSDYSKIIKCILAEAED